MAILTALIYKALFFYFGYRDDYRRNENAFWKTFILTPIMMILFAVIAIGIPLALVGLLYKAWQYFYWSVLTGH